MRAVEGDARRYAWCRGRALWLVAMPITSWEEDLDGALEAGQHGLVRHCGQALGEVCAVALVLALRRERPIPPQRVRGAWALERLAGHELHEDVWRLIQGADDDADAIHARCKRVIAHVREVVGDVPDPLTSEGYFPALALARDWLQLLEALGEEGFLPREWTRT